jgi:hypothetical protein
MAVVYVARQLDLDRTVALKELRVFRSAEAAFAQRFLREAKLAGSFNHPNIVTVYDYFEFDGLPYIAMEYMPRGSLRGHVGRVTLAQAGVVLEGVLAGLAHAERKFVVHRDIKPENLLVTGEGAVKIADFGIAKATSAVETGGLTSTGMTVGTPNYIAPEQAMAHELGPWTDLYSLGLTTFELFAGRAPFADTQEPMAIVLRQLNEQVPPLSAVAPHVDPMFSEWVGWLASKSPADRPHAAMQAWDALEEILLARLGPRWRHGALLSDPGQPRTTVADRLTRRRTDPRLATTLPPQRPLAAPVAAPVRPRRRRKPIKLAAAAAVLLAVAGVAVAGRQSRAPVTVATSVPAATSQPPPAQDSLAGRVAPARGQARSYERLAARLTRRVPRSAADTRLASDLRGVADNYEAAATAAARGDRAGYADSIMAANAGAEAVAGRVDESVGPASPLKPKTAQKKKPKRTSSPKPAPVQHPTVAPPAPAPRATQPAVTEAPPSSCAGDSLSDDPSDDECGE